MARKTGNNATDKFWDEQQQIINRSQDGTDEVDQLLHAVEAEPILPEEK